MLAAILVCSTCLAVVATAVQLLVEYRGDVSKIESRLGDIENSYLDGIGASLWNMDDAQSRQLISGLLKLPDIDFVELRDTKGKRLMAVGEPVVGKPGLITRQMPVRYALDGTAKSKVLVGTLTLTATLERTYGELRDKAFIILITQTAKTTIVAIFTLFIFRYLVSRHLTAIASYARRLDINNLGGPLVLARPCPKYPDELSDVVVAFNGMSDSLKRDMADLERAVRQRQQAQQEAQAARENEARYRQVVEMSPDAIIVERQDRIVFANRGALNLLGAADLAQVLGLSMPELVTLQAHPSRWSDTASMAGRDSNESSAIEGKLTRFDGSCIDVELHRAAFTYEGDVAIQTVIHDITRHKEYEEKLRKQALHDGLTGLPNRILLMDRLQQAMAHADRKGHSVVVMFIDLDRFKYINDTLGHEAGDELLRTVASRIIECVRKCDTLARLGGDEFVMLVDEVKDQDTITFLLQRAMKKISEPIMLGSQEVSVTCSIGTSIYPQDGSDAVTLLKYADTAMYCAKEKGRNGVQRYTADMHRRANEHLVMETHLRHALERNQFLLHFQPQIDLRSGAICGVEALIRWQHPELGPIAPLRFIPLAEETGLIIPIGEWVMREACAQAKAWQRSGLPALRVSVNLSARQLGDPEIEGMVQRALRDADLPARYLELEITESVSMISPERTIGILSRLKAMGVGVAIDDFGTGYSNLSYLRHFPVDRLKLDRSFVRDLIADGPKRKTDAALACAIVNIGHSLQLKVVAEGIEEPEQLAKLVACGCDEMQGYFFSRPVTADQITRMLGEQRVLDLSACVGPPCCALPASLEQA